MKATLIIASALLLLIITIPILFRIRKDLKKKRNFVNTYAIQNVSSGNCVRPYNAGIYDGTAIISYSHKDWECITWEFIKMEGNTFLLKNLYTQKTFQPSSNIKSGVGLWQQPLGGTQLQYWEFVQQSNEAYLIKLKGADLYLTASSNKVNSPIVLMPKQQTEAQEWKLIRQTPWI